LLSTPNRIHCPVSSGIRVQFKTESVSSILRILQDGVSEPGHGVSGLPGLVMTTKGIRINRGIKRTRGRTR